MTKLTARDKIKAIELYKERKNFQQIAIELNKPVDLVQDWLVSIKDIFTFTLPNNIQQVFDNMRPKLLELGISNETITDKFHDFLDTFTLKTLSTWNTEKIQNELHNFIQPSSILYHSALDSKTQKNKGVTIMTPAASEISDSIHKEQQKTCPFLYHI